MRLSLENISSWWIHCWLPDLSNEDSAFMHPVNHFIPTHVNSSGNYSSHQKECILKKKKTNLILLTPIPMISDDEPKVGLALNKSWYS